MTRGAFSVGFTLSMFAGACSSERNVVVVPTVPAHEGSALVSVADAGLAEPVCGRVFRRGSFCEEFAELTRITQEDGASRRCLRAHSEDTRSPVAGIPMNCHVHPIWDKECAGNRAGQTKVMIDCRLYIGYEYKDKEHELTNYVRSAAAAVAACDPAYRASPLRPLGARDHAVVLSRPPDPGTSLKRVVAVCSELGDLPPSEEDGRAEVVPAHYNVVVQIYGATP